MIGRLPVIVPLVPAAGNVHWGEDVWGRNAYEGCRRRKLCSTRLTFMAVCVSEMSPADATCFRDVLDISFW